jgi:hypothetical protein
MYFIVFECIQYIACYTYVEVQQKLDRTSYKLITIAFTINIFFNNLSFQYSYVFVIGTHLRTYICHSTTTSFPIHFVSNIFIYQFIFTLSINP